MQNVESNAEQKEILDFVHQKAGEGIELLGKAIAALNVVSKILVAHDLAPLPAGTFGFERCAGCSAFTIDSHKLGDTDLHICRRCWAGVMEIADDFPAELNA